MDWQDVIEENFPFGAQFADWLSEKLLEVARRVEPLENPDGDVKFKIRDGRLYVNIPGNIFCVALGEALFEILKEAVACQFCGAINLRGFTLCWKCGEKLSE